MWVIHSSIPRPGMTGMSQLAYSLAALRTCTPNSALAVAHMTAAALLRFCSQEGALKLHAGRVAILVHKLTMLLLSSHGILWTRMV